MEHRRLDGGVQKYLYSAFKKYGLENFSFNILEVCTKEESITKEKEYINKYNSYENGYNETLGGEDGEVSSLYKHRYEIVELLENEEIQMKEIAEKYNVTKALICMINKGKRCYIEGIDYPIRKSNIKKQYFCKDCGKEITRKNKTQLCKNCKKKYIQKPVKSKLKVLNNKKEKPRITYIVQRKTFKPSAQELIKNILETSITTTAKKYGVTDNSIKKWLKSYNEPYKIPDIYAKYAPERLIKPKKEKYKYSAGYDETKKVKMWNDTICHTFSNVDMCAKYINKTIDSDIEDIKYGIRRVIRGKRQTYHGYSFCYL